MTSTDVDVAVKTCRGCGETKSLAHYYKTKSTRDGLQSRCKSCHIEVVKARKDLRRAEMGEDAWLEQQRQMQRKRRSDPETRENDYRHSRRVAAAMAELRDRHRKEYDAILARLRYEDDTA
jgi:hypothetical protein